MLLMKSMTHYSESLLQMLPFMSKMHQNRWGSLQRSPGPLAVKGWDGDLVTTLVGVDFDMCPLACDRCPLAVLKLATGLKVSPSQNILKMHIGYLKPCNLFEAKIYLFPVFPVTIQSFADDGSGSHNSHFDHIHIFRFKYMRNINVMVQI